MAQTVLLLQEKRRQERQAAAQANVVLDEEISVSDDDDDEFMAKDSVASITFVALSKVDKKLFLLFILL